MVKTLPAMQETWVQFLGREDPLQYSCLGNPMDRGAWQLQSMGSQGVRHNLVTKQHPNYTNISNNIYSLHVLSYFPILQQVLIHH